MIATQREPAQARCDAFSGSVGRWVSNGIAAGCSLRLQKALSKFTADAPGPFLVRHAPRLILTVFALGGCSVADIVHIDSKSSAIIPALRYVAYTDGSTRYEDISEGNPEIADEIANIPVAQGAMKVDCANLREIGILIRHGERSRGKFYGRHDYNYVVSWPDETEAAPKHFTYEDQLIHWYLRGSARFLEPLADGPLSLSVTHRREKIYTTEFDMIGCP